MSTEVLNTKQHQHTLLPMCPQKVDTWCSSLLYQTSGDTLPDQWWHFTRPVV